MAGLREILLQTQNNDLPEVIESFLRKYSQKTKGSEKLRLPEVQERQLLKVLIEIDGINEYLGLKKLFWSIIEKVNLTIAPIDLSPLVKGVDKNKMLEVLKWVRALPIKGSNIIETGEFDPDPDYKLFRMPTISEGIRPTGFMGRLNHIVKKLYPPYGEIVRNTLAKRWLLLPGDVKAWAHSWSNASKHANGSNCSYFIPVMRRLARNNLLFRNRNHEDIVDVDSFTPFGQVSPFHRFIVKYLLDYDLAMPLAVYCSWYKLHRVSVESFGSFTGLQSTPLAPSSDYIAQLALRDVDAALATAMFIPPQKGLVSNLHHAANESILSILPQRIWQRINHTSGLQKFLQLTSEENRREAFFVDARYDNLFAHSDLKSAGDVLKISDKPTSLHSALQFAIEKSRHRVHIESVMGRYSRIAPKLVASSEDSTTVSTSVVSQIEKGEESSPISSMRTPVMSRCFGKLASLEFATGNLLGASHSVVRQMEVVASRMMLQNFDIVGPLTKKGSRKVRSRAKILRAMVHELPNSLRSLQQAIYIAKTRFTFFSRKIYNLSEINPPSWLLCDLLLSIGRCLHSFHVSNIHSILDQAFVDGLVLMNELWNLRRTKPYSLEELEKGYGMKSQINRGSSKGTPKAPGVTAFVRLLIKTIDHPKFSKHELSGRNLVLGLCGIQTLFHIRLNSRELSKSTHYAIQKAVSSHHQANFKMFIATIAQLPLAHMAHGLFLAPSKENSTSQDATVTALLNVVASFVKKLGKSDTNAKMDKVLGYYLLKAALEDTSYAEPLITLLAPRFGARKGDCFVTWCILQLQRYPQWQVVRGDVFRDARRGLRVYPDDDSTSETLPVPQTTMETTGEEIEEGEEVGRDIIFSKDIEFGLPEFKDKQVGALDLHSVVSERKQHVDKNGNVWLIHKYGRSLLRTANGVEYLRALVRPALEASRAAQWALASDSKQRASIFLPPFDFYSIITNLCHQGKLRILEHGLEMFYPNSPLVDVVKYVLCFAQKRFLDGQTYLRNMVFKQLENDSRDFQVYDLQTQGLASQAQNLLLAANKAIEVLKFKRSITEVEMKSKLKSLRKILIPLLDSNTARLDQNRPSAELIIPDPFASSAVWENWVVAIKRKGEEKSLRVRERMDISVRVRHKRWTQVTCFHLLRSCFSSLNPLVTLDDISEPRSQSSVYSSSSGAAVATARILHAQLSSAKYPFINHLGLFHGLEFKSDDLPAATDREFPEAPPSVIDAPKQSIRETTLKLFSGSILSSEATRFAFSEESGSLTANRKLRGQDQKSLKSGQHITERTCKELLKTFEDLLREQRFLSGTTSRAEYIRFGSFDRRALALERTRAIYEAFSSLLKVNASELTIGALCYRFHLVLKHAQSKAPELQISMQETFYLLYTAYSHWKNFCDEKGPFTAVRLREWLPHLRRRLQWQFFITGEKEIVLPVLDCRRKQIIRGLLRASDLHLPNSVILQDKDPLVGLRQLSSLEGKFERRLNSGNSIKQTDKGALDLPFFIKVVERLYALAFFPLVTRLLTVATSSEKQLLPVPLPGRLRAILRGLRKVRVAIWISGLSSNSALGEAPLVVQQTVDIMTGLADAAIQRGGNGMVTDWDRFLAVDERTDDTLQHYVRQLEEGVGGGLASGKKAAGDTIGMRMRWTVTDSGPAKIILGGNWTTLKSLITPNDLQVILPLIEKKDSAASLELLGRSWAGKDGQDTVPAYFCRLLAHAFRFASGESKVRGRFAPQQLSRAAILLCKMVPMATLSLQVIEMLATRLKSSVLPLAKSGPLGVVKRLLGSPRQLLYLLHSYLDDTRMFSPITTGVTLNKAYSEAISQIYPFSSYKESNDLDFERPEIITLSDDKSPPLTEHAKLDSVQVVYLAMIAVIDDNQHTWNWNNSLWGKQDFAKFAGECRKISSPLSTVFLRQAARLLQSILDKMRKSSAILKQNMGNVESKEGVKISSAESKAAQLALSGPPISLHIAMHLCICAYFLLVVNGNKKYNLQKAKYLKGENSVVESVKDINEMNLGDIAPGGGIKSVFLMISVFTTRIASLVQDSTPAGKKFGAQLTGFCIDQIARSTGDHYLYTALRSLKNPEARHLVRPQLKAGAMLSQERSKLFFEIQLALKEKWGYELHIALAELLTKIRQLYSALVRSNMMGQAVKILNMYHLMAIELEFVHFKVRLFNWVDPNHQKLQEIWDHYIGLHLKKIRSEEPISSVLRMPVDTLSALLSDAFLATVSDQYIKQTIHEWTEASLAFEQSSAEISLGGSARNVHQPTQDIFLDLNHTRNNLVNQFLGTRLTPEQREKGLSKLDLYAIAFEEDEKQKQKPGLDSSSKIRKEGIDKDFRMIYLRQNRTTKLIELGIDRRDLKEIEAAERTIRALKSSERKEGFKSFEVRLFLRCYPGYGSRLYDRVKVGRPRHSSQDQKHVSFK